MLSLAVCVFLEKKINRSYIIYVTITLFLFQLFYDSRLILSVIISVVGVVLYLVFQFDKTSNKYIHIHFKVHFLLGLFFILQISQLIYFSITSDIENIKIPLSYPILLLTVVLILVSKDKILDDFFYRPYWLISESVILISLFYVDSKEYYPIYISIAALLIFIKFYVRRYIPNIIDIK